MDFKIKNKKELSFGSKHHLKQFVEDDDYLEEEPRMGDELPNPAEPLRAGDLFAPMNPFKIRDDNPILPD